MPNPSSTLEALLFAEGGPLTTKKLCSILSCDAGTLDGYLNTLSAQLDGRGIALVRTETEVALAVSPALRDVVAETLLKEQDRDIGDAGLEILAVLLYEGPSTRAAIDHIRGVNSSSTLRTLISRGLAERVANPTDAREYVYRPTIELLTHLGIRDGKELPDYATIANELAAFKKSAVFHAESGTSGTDSH